MAKKSSWGKTTKGKNISDMSIEEVIEGYKAGEIEPPSDEELNGRIDRMARVLGVSRGKMKYWASAVSLSTSEDKAVRESVAGIIEEMNQAIDARMAELNSRLSWGDK